MPRIPFSSENPLVPELRGETPCIKVLNKADLADPAITALWQRHFEAEAGVKTIPISQQIQRKSVPCWIYVLNYCLIVILMSVVPAP